jgi:CPA1 family monovalent cation:H+ antiporter
MRVFEVVVALLLGGAALAAIARRIGAPYPALVALAGAALALMPGVPTVALDPDLALALFVAPVLLDAAFDSSPRDLRANWRQVASLALGAVALTIVVVAVVARVLVPGMPWAVAIAIGAIVAPPDAAAATTVLKQLRPPHRLLVILEGESLFNDASALLVYRIAVGTTATGFLSGWSVLPMLLLVTGGSVVLGLVLSRIVLAVTRRIRDVATAVVVQFCGTFAVWLVAERLHLSGIITMVVFAIAAARRAPQLTPARIRIPSYAVWEVAVFVLNVLAFILVGFQLKSLSGRVTGAAGARYAGIAVVICAAVIAARIAWVSAAAALSRWMCRPRPDGVCPPDRMGLTPRGAAVVGWCGMRGTVTLAAALALPTHLDGGAAFPHRDLVVVIAFGVVLGTLVVQGLSLRPLLLHLRLEDDRTVDREARLARVEALRSAAAATQLPQGAGAAHLVRQSYALQLERAEADLARHEDRRTEDAAPPSLAAEDDVAVLHAALRAQRRRLLALRADGTIGDAAFQQLEEELDWMELGWQQVMATEERRL